MLFDNHLDLVWLIVFTLPIYCINGVYLSVLRAERKILAFSFFNSLRTILLLIFVLLLVLITQMLSLIITGILIVELLIFTFLTIYLLMSYPIGKLNLDSIKPMLLFGIPLIPSSIVWWLVASSDRYMITYFLGIPAAGVYSVGYGLGILIQTLVMPIDMAVTPALAKLFDNNDYDNVKLYLQNSIHLYLLFAIPAFFGLSVLSHPILLIMSTSEIASGAYLITPIVAAGAFCWGCYNFLVKSLILEKRTPLLASVWSIAAILNIVLNIIIIPIWGIIGAAATTFLAYFIVMLIGVAISRKTLPFRLNWSFIFKCLISSIVMSIILALIKPVGIIGIIASTVIGICIYFCLLVILRGQLRNIMFFSS